MIKDNWKFVLSTFMIIFIIAYFVITAGDTKNKRANFDGLVLTDKAGKSYMLEYTSSSKFNVVEFDVQLMRAKRP